MTELCLWCDRERAREVDGFCSDEHEAAYAATNTEERKMEWLKATLAWYAKRNQRLSQSPQRTVAEVWADKAREMREKEGK